MARKPIPDTVQNSILLRSRRRCCLCFWLKGIDEVQKGQIAHIDQDSENPEEENLSFLCFDHHDEYDGMTRLAKGLKPDEVRHWRDELYREMEYRFRSFKKRGFDLSFVGFKYLGPKDQINARFRLKNTGEVEAKSPTVTIRLPDNIRGELPEQQEEFDAGHGLVASMPRFDPWAAREERQDLFEPNGRVCIWELPGQNPVLMADHAFKFDALLIRLRDFEQGAQILLEYRVDAEGMAPVLGTAEATLPTGPNDFVADED